MVVKLSKMYGMDMYSEGAGYIGKVNDIILNMDKGEVVRITTVPIRDIAGTDAKDILQKNSVLFDRVESIKDIVLVGKHHGHEAEE
ncbi:MAG: hypothetical protein V1911_01645 [Candidatus Micrarchaeota archaeon]